MVSCAMTHLGKSIGSFAFVDNTNLYVSRQPNAEQMAMQMQQSVTNWEVYKEQWAAH